MECLRNKHPLYHGKIYVSFYKRSVSNTRIKIEKTDSLYAFRFKFERTDAFLKCAYDTLFLEF